MDIKNEQQSTFRADYNNIKACFQVYANPQQNKDNIKEAEAYMAQCPQDPEFPSMLLKMFSEQTELGTIRLFALIQFKNLAKETWKIRRASKYGSAYSDEFKQQVREFLVKCLEDKNDKLIRRQLDDALKIICLSDFPLNYKSLVDYFIRKTEELSEVITDQHALMGDETMAALRTIKIILTEKSPKRFGNMEEIFHSIYFKMLQNFHKFWDYFHTHIQSVIANTHHNNVEQIEHFLKLARRADQIYLAILCNGCDEMLVNETVIQVVGLLVQRALELTKIVHLLHSEKRYPEIYEAADKNLYKLLFGISQLQIAFPLLFKDVLTDYLEVIEYIISNAESFENELTLRAAVICLTSVIKCYLYYSEDVYLLQKRKIEQFVDIQKETYAKYYSYFTPEKIENLFQLFLVKLLPRRKFLSTMETTDNFEELIEIDDEQTVDEYEKLDNSLYNLTSACFMSLLQQFPTVAIPIIHTLCLRVVRHEVEMPSSTILDGLFSIIGLLPAVYRKKNIDPSQYLDFGSILKFLENQGKQDVNLAKRIPVLIHKWINLFNLEIKLEVIKLIVDVTKSLDNYLIRYECCMCLKSALESDIRLDLDYIAISEQLVPLIVDLLHKFLNPQIVWGLIGLLKSLFTKAQFITQNNAIVTQIQSLSIETLIQANYEPLLNAVADMLKTLIASFPPGTELQAIYNLCLQLIDYQLSKGQAKMYVLSLWLFIAKEYQSVQKLDNEMKALFAKYFQAIIAQNQPYELAMGLNIIEEYLLAGLIGSDDYAGIIKMIEDLYKNTLVDSPTEEVFEVKAAILGMVSTIFLIFLENKATQDLSLFHNLLFLLLQDMFKAHTGPSCRAYRIFRTMVLTIVNRFIILDLESILNILQSNNVNFYDFINLWVSGMNSLSSKPAMRLNVLAIIQIVPHMNDKEAFLTHFSMFLKHTLAEVEDFAEQGGQTPTFGYQNPTMGVNDRIRDVRDSERKRSSRQSHLYFDVNLKDAFVKVFKEAITKLELPLEQIAQAVNDESLIRRFINIMEN